MKRIVFSGYLAKMYPNGIEIDFKSAWEAMEALTMWPGFRREDGKLHEVILPQFQSVDALKAETMVDEIHVVPMVVGAGGKGGLIQIIIGATLIAVGIFTANPMLVKMGAMMVVSGLVQMLMPAPEAAQSGSQEEKSAYIPANKNTSKIGTRIPVLYGRRRVWGHFLSLNVTAGTKPGATPPATVPIGGSSSVTDSNYEHWEYVNG